MDEAIAEALERGGGVAARWQLLMVTTEGRLRWAVRRGELRVVRRGAYAATDRLAAADEQGRLALLTAAEQAVRRREEVASGATAARLHGLPVLGRPLSAPRLSLPREPGERPREDRPRSWMPDEDVCLVGGLLVTTVARTVVDVARTRPFAFGVATADAALRQGCDPAEVQRVLHRCRTWPGSRTARRVLAFADARADSPLESLGRARFEEQQLPPPELQVDLGDEDGPVVVDHYWREQRTVVEADGVLKYRTPGDLVAEKLREDRLRDRGEQVVRYGWEDAMVRPAALAARVRRAFARQRAA